MNDPSAILPPETTPPPSNDIFRGPNGLRAGWRVLIFLALAGACLLLLGVAVLIASHGHAQLGVSQSSPLGTFLPEAAIFFVSAMPALIMARIERRKFGAYGLPARSAFRGDFWIGTLVGFLAISACLLGIFAFHGFRLIGLGIHGSTIALATLAWAVAFIMVGLAEEFGFRGYLQYTVASGIGFWPAAILLSLLFGYAHSRNTGETTPGLVSVVLFGLLFCLFLRRTGNLWFAVGFHAGWDWGQTFFYGVPDSGMAASNNLFNCAFHGPAWLTGGTVGPEASIFTPIVLAIVGILFLKSWRQASDVSLNRGLRSEVRGLKSEV